MKILKSSRGFSLPEVMIAVAISGVIALGASKMMTDNYKNQNYLQTLSEINQTMALIQGTLGNPAVCNKNLSQYSQANKAALDAGVSINAGIDVPVASNPALSVKKWGVGAYGKFEITGITLRTNTANANLKDFIFTFVWKQRPYLSTAVISKTVSVYAAVDYGQNGTLENGDLYKCGAVVSDTKLEGQKALCVGLDPNAGTAYPCAAAQFACWNPTTSKCEIKSFSCPTGQIPNRISSLGNVVCKTTESALDLNSLIESAPVACPTTSSNIRIEFTGGKFRLICL